MSLMALKIEKNLLYATATCPPSSENVGTATDGCLFKLWVRILDNSIGSDSTEATALGFVFLRVLQFLEIG